MSSTCRPSTLPCVRATAPSRRRRRVPSSYPIRSYGGTGFPTGARHRIVGDDRRHFAPRTPVRDVPQLHARQRRFFCPEPSGRVWREAAFPGTHIAASMIERSLREREAAVVPLAGRVRLRSLAQRHDGVAPRVVRLSPAGGRSGVPVGAGPCTSLRLLYVELRACSPDQPNLIGEFLKAKFQPANQP